MGAGEKGEAPTHGVAQLFADEAPVCTQGQAEGRDILVLGICLMAYYPSGLRVRACVLEDELEYYVWRAARPASSRVRPCRTLQSSTTVQVSV